MNNMTDETQNVLNSQVAYTADYDTSKKVIGIGETLTADGGMLRRKLPAGEVKAPVAPTLAPAEEAATLVNPLQDAVGVPSYASTVPSEPSVAPNPGMLNSTPEMPAPVSEPAVQNTFVPPAEALPAEQSVYQEAQNFMNDVPPVPTMPTLHTPAVPTEPVAPTAPLMDTPVAAPSETPVETPVAPVFDTPAAVESTPEPVIPTEMVAPVMTEPTPVLEERHVETIKPEVISIDKAEYERILTELSDLEVKVNKLVNDLKALGYTETKEESVVEEQEKPLSPVMDELPPVVNETVTPMDLPPMPAAEPELPVMDNLPSMQEAAPVEPTPMNNIPDLTSQLNAAQGYSQPFTL